MDISKLSIEHETASNRKLINGRYRILNKIGQGQFGKVLLAENIDNATAALNGAAFEHKYVAIKTINRIDKTRLITKTYMSHSTKIKREIQIMKECSHPNVVQLYQVIDDMKFDKILLVLEYCQFGEIDWKKYNHYHEKHFKKDRGLPLNRILRDVVSGLEYLHDFKHIIHRDLKPSNLLISADKTIKISDFGVSLILENNANDDKELAKTMGTPAFYAPELCQFVNNRLSTIKNPAQNIKIDSRIDLWSLGVVLYCLIFHTLPFNGANEFGLFKSVVNDRLQFPTIKKTAHTTNEDVSELRLLKDLISRLLAKDPAQRITLRGIKDHPFTTLGLKSRSEVVKFKTANAKIFQQQRRNSPEEGLTTKLRNFFMGRGETTPLPPTSLGKQQRQQQDQDRAVLGKLEAVDDLLDSYFDDSSSMGSLDEEETEPVVTKDMLSSVIDTESENLDSNDDFSRLRANLEAAVGLFRARVSAPPALNLLGSFHSARSSLDSSPFAQSTPSPFYSPLTSPNTPNSTVVTIGAGLPSSLKLVFSPSRRFFARYKKKKNDDVKHTIVSLASPNKKKSKKTFTDLEPPPVFGGSGLAPPVFIASTENEVVSDSLSSSPQVAQSGFSSRKNSFSLMRSIGLSRITSSSSLLNLNAYLTDDTLLMALVSGTSAVPRAGPAQAASSSSLDEEADVTLTADDTDQALQVSSRPLAMNEYLDSLL